MCSGGAVVRLQRVRKRRGLRGVRLPYGCPQTWRARLAPVPWRVVGALSGRR